MGYLHINNLYKDTRILEFKEADGEIVLSREAKRAIGRMCGKLYKAYVSNITLL